MMEVARLARLCWAVFGRHFSFRLVLFLSVGLALSSSEAGSIGGITFTPPHQLLLDSSIGPHSSSKGRWSTGFRYNRGQQVQLSGVALGTRPEPSSTQIEIADVVDGPGVNSRVVAGQPRPTTRRLPLRLLIQSRVTRGPNGGRESDGGPSGKDSRGPGSVGRGSGVSRGTSSPSKGRVTHRASAGGSSSSGGGGNSPNSGGGSSSSSSGSRSRSYSSRSGNRRTSLESGTPAISTYQWLVNQMQDNP